MDVQKEENERRNELREISGGSPPKGVHFGSYRDCMADNCSLLIVYEMQSWVLRIWRTLGLILSFSKIFPILEFNYFLTLQNNVTNSAKCLSLSPQTR